ncbi:hypothetical protein KA057_00065 [Candidatus Gracilibacteria bacterium]|jgi:hypothetical protein|nr:hypothetical protein [Candidatus Gracilibacteria bacterium]
MKKLLVLMFLLSGVAFAALDTDSDGVSDEADICPRVYARSTSGCPTLTVSSAPISVNACINAQKKAGKIVATITPVCDSVTKVCPKVNAVFGAQSCDPLFPIIFDATGNVLVRGSVYILDYTK